MTTNEKVLIKVENLQKSFEDNKVLDGISTEIRQGEVVAVIGPSGSGKSTFLRSLNRLEIPTGGKIYFEGVDITAPETDIDHVRQKIGMVFQQFNLLDSKTVFHNIALPLILEKAPKDVIEEKVNEVLRFVELEDKKDTYVSQLSGGQKQRLCIARAILKSPRVLILDDSTSAVDTATEAAIRESFKNELKDTTRIIIAQRISSVQDADRILVLDDGKIIGSGTHEELLRTCRAYEEIYVTQTGENRAEEAEA